MLMLLSPAKNLDETPAAPGLDATTPRFLEDARALAGVARGLSARKLGKLMDISDKLAELNRDRFQAFRGDGASNAQKPAALMFNGDVYLGLDAKTLSADDLAYAQDRLRILSGLYGLLRPLDAIEPYRLEMGSKLKNPRGKDLYAFWGTKIAEAVNDAAAQGADGVVVNLASKEYFAAVDPATLKGPLVTPSFHEEKGGKLRTLQFFAKRARGMMARWAIVNRIDRAEDLKAFNVDGYAFHGDLSAGDQWVFARAQPALKTPPKNAKAA